tara:strand:- start:300 stop:806 length:507 start_codon:yes stop_codon:yes gene_type:complete
MIRSVYDTIVSFYFHNTTHHNRYDNNIKSFIREPYLGVNRWIRYINSWSSRLASDNILVITYENLHKKPVELLSEVVAFLNIPFDEEILIDSLKLSTFETMKTIEISDGIIDHDYDRSDKNARRIRKGKIKGYTEYLNEEDIQYIKNQLELNLNSNSKDILLLNGFHP